MFYGPKRQSTLIAIDAKEFLQKVSALEGSHLIRFRSTAADLADKVALVKEAQYHPVTGAILHADFYEVDLTQKLRVRVPLHFTGKAAGVALGGILQPVQRDVEVECLPGDIPEFIDVDVSALDIHDAVHVSELQAPEGVKRLLRHRRHAGDRAAADGRRGQGRRGSGSCGRCAGRRRGGCRRGEGRTGEERLIARTVNAFPRRVGQPRQRVCQTLATTSGLWWWRNWRDDGEPRSNPDAACDLDRRDRW